MTSLTLDTRPHRRFWAVLMTPAVAMFLSANVANVGNLVFNMLFSRWMGPALFADLAMLLTLKLSLLALLNALQMAVSQVTSAGPDRGVDQAIIWLNRVVFVALGLALPLLVPAAMTGALAARLGLDSSVALIILLFALPVTAPLCLARGVALGRVDLRGLVLSSNLEMVVRLGGAALAWQVGLGLEGVVLALAASLVAGWWPLRAVLRGTARLQRPVLRRVAALALPFAVLQAAQVGHLDGDVLMANLLLTKTDAGLAAVLSLFQRIQFFACFGLAAVLLPSVNAAVVAGRSGLAELRPVAVLFAGLSLPLLLILSLYPGPVLLGLSGPAFAAATPVLAQVGLAAVLFTFSYLGATFLAATGDRRGIWLIAAFLPIQIGLYLMAHRSGLLLSVMVDIKTGVQAVLAALILALAAFRLAQCHPLTTEKEFSS